MHKMVGTYLFVCSSWIASYSFGNLQRESTAGKLYSDTQVFISPELPVTVSSIVKLCAIGFEEFVEPEAPGTGRVERKWEGGGASEGSWFPILVVANDAFAI